MHPLRACAAAVLAALLALPACKKKDDGNDGESTLGLRSTPRTRGESRNRLMQVGLAMHSYHDATNHLPAGVYGPGGKVGLSWRVQILPYIEHDNLYRQFKLDEPWDSEHNRRLLPMMPKVYAPPEDIDTNGHTYLRAFSGRGALIEPPKEVAPPGTAVRGRRITSMADGTSNTAMVVEAAEAVPWTKPEEIPYQANGPLPKIGGVYRDGVHVLFCDGAVRFFEGPMPAHRLAALITPSGGEVVGFDD